LYDLGNPTRTITVTSKRFKSSLRFLAVLLATVVVAALIVEIIKLFV
jgi:hypothetical protein